MSKRTDKVAPLKDVESFNFEHLLMVNEVARDLLKENHPQAMKLLLFTQALNHAHEAVGLISAAMTSKANNAVSIQKKKAEFITERDKLIYQEYLSEFLPKGRMSGYALKLSQRWTQKTGEYISPKTIANIVSKQKAKAK